MRVKCRYTFNLCKDFNEFQQEINNAIERLTPIIEREQRFFGELAFELLANHWVLQKHNTNSYGTLFVNYGFRFGIYFNNLSGVNVF